MLLIVFYSKPEYFIIFGSQQKPRSKLVSFFINNLNLVSSEKITIKHKIIAMTSFETVLFTYFCGLGSTMISSPVIHPFNVIAASAARTQQTSGAAAMSVYQGLGSNSPNNIKNFWNGLAGHCSKELVRSVGRIGGVVYVEKYCKEHFSPSLAPHILATAMATYEVIFANPADVWKSYRSTGLTTRVPDLFKGSLGNFLRQYGMWFVWSSTIPIINNKFQQYNIDKDSLGGVAFRSFLQAIACTVVTYPTELVLRTVQVRSDEYPVKNLPKTLRFVARACVNPSLIATDGAYFRVVADLVKKNGVRGIGLGMTAKLIGNTFLLSNANYLPMISGTVKKHIYCPPSLKVDVEKK